MRAYHPDDVLRSNGSLTIDFEWYLSNQILPPISRLCEPIEGTSSATLANCLGLQVAASAARKEEDDDWAFTAKIHMDDAERFRDCEELALNCTSCGHNFAFCGVYNSFGCSGLVCPQCHASYFGRRYGQCLQKLIGFVCNVSYCI
jgi:DNA polymerase alpha subunit A